MSSCPLDMGAIQRKKTESFEGINSVSYEVARSWWFKSPANGWRSTSKLDREVLGFEALDDDITWFEAEFESESMCFKVNKTRYDVRLQKEYHRRDPDRSPPDSPLGRWRRGIRHHLQKQYAARPPRSA